jgi:hypothetical protein
MAIAPNRAVAVLTPLVFAPLAGTISVFVARHVPGVEIDGASLQAIFIAGATIAFGKAGLWLKGWQEHEKIEAAMPAAVPDEDDADLGDEPEPELEPEMDMDLEDDLEPAVG